VRADGPLRRDRDRDRHGGAGPPAPVPSEPGLRPALHERSLRHCRPLRARALHVGAGNPPRGRRRGRARMKYVFILTLLIVVASGRQDFQIFCVPCHGPEAKGGVTGPVATKFIPTPDLTNAQLQKQRTDGYWHSYIVAGGAVMPSYGEALSSEEAWHIVNYLRTLAQK